MKQTITFDKSARQDILKMFNKDVDAEGYIVEKDNPTQRVLSPDGEEVKLNQFVAVAKGSQLFFKSDLLSLLKLSDKVK